MSVAESLKRLELKVERLLEEVVLEAARKRATLILFGSRARGNHCLTSDYDILAVCSGEPVKGRGLMVNVFNVRLEDLEEEVFVSPVVLAAVLEGRVLSDPLKLRSDLTRLRRRLAGLGASVTPERIVMPKRSDAS